jgi:hypothetical protein
VHPLFPQLLRIKVPEGLPAAVEVAAKQRHQSAPEWVRQAILKSLELDGVRLRADGKVVSGSEVAR